MTVRAIAGKIKLSCTTCSADADNVPFREEEWSAMIAGAKRRGWKIERKHGEWRHDCPQCSGQASFL